MSITHLDFIGLRNFSWSFNGALIKSKVQFEKGAMDETYSLFFVTKVPKDVKEEQFLFAIAVLDQSYWIIGSGIGALLGNVLPFSTEGIDFAMTALFVVIMVEQWMEKQNRPSVVIGLVCGLVCRLVFGADNFILPTMICVMVILLSCKKIFDKMIPEDGKEGGEPECQ